MEKQWLTTKRFQSKRSWTGALMLFSLLGMIIHNRLEIPDMPLTNPEFVFPGLTTLILFLGFWLQPRYHKVWEWLILVWAALQLIGGAIISVLPLAILPFTPAQSISHYLSHVLYGVTQLPLLIFVGYSVLGKPSS